jgi:hypothetical protein
MFRRCFLVILTKCFLLSHNSEAVSVYYVNCYRTQTRIPAFLFVLVTHWFFLRRTIHREAGVCRVCSQQQSWFQRLVLLAIFR